MNQLVFIKNNRIVTDSLMISEVFGKSHDNVMRDIKNQIEKLNEAGEQEFSLLNFKESAYTNERGRQYRKYLLTEEAFSMVVMAYITVEAMKFKVRFINEFNRMKEYIQKQQQPVGEREQLRSVMKLAFYHDEDIKQIKTDVEQLKEEVGKRMTIDYGQQQAIRNAKAARVKYLWENGAINKEVHDTTSKVHAAVGKALKDAFAVSSYRDILVKDFDEAVAFVKAWRPRLV